MYTNALNIQHSDLALSEIIQTSGYHIFLRKDNILQLQMYNSFYVELDDAINILECIIKLSNGSKYPLLVIYADDNLFSNETRTHIAKHTLTKADALVGTSLALRIVGNFYLNINKPIRPTRMFDDELSAIKWLTTFA